ncbi:MAG: hypothetical protein WCD79_20730 [Chthoniobacteraceae bacterium]
MKQSESGSSLMAVLILICTMVLIMGAVFLITTGEARFMKRSLDRAVAIAYADGVDESLFDQWRAAMSNGQSLSQTQKTLGPTGAELTGSFSVAAPTSSVLPVPTGMSLSSWSIAAATPYGVALSSTSRPTLENGTNSTLLIRMYYSASATVSFPHGGLVTVQRTFTRAGTNIFNNFLFSTQPVTEISPGANMYVNGTIYAGGNLYVSNTTLNLQQDVSYTGNYTVGYAPGDPDHSGNAATPNYPSGDPPHLGTTQMLIDAVTSEFDQNYIGAGSYSDPGVYSSSTNSLVTDKNDKGYHELLEQQTTPVSSNADPMQIDTAGDNERLASNADYRIIVDANNNVTLYTGTNTTATTSGTAYTSIMNAIITDTAFKDGRVGDTVRAVTIDVGKITTAYNSGAIVDNNIYAGKQANDGLLLYIQDTSAGTSVTTNGYNYNISGTSGTIPWHTATISGTSPTITSSSARGVRLVNGGSLPAGGTSGTVNPYGGLTIASPNPVYIQGDYNTGSTLTGSFTSAGTTMNTQPLSNGTSAYPTGTSAPSPVVGSGTSAYVRQPAVVAADAVTILSNAWSDSTSAPPMDVAANTTINTAIVSGNVPTTSSHYSGGIENFPRLLEDWSTGSENLTIYGSFALLYNSEQATQPWLNTGNYYNAPNRRWFFDSTLQNHNPPGFPAAYTYTRGPWKTQ